MTTKMAEYCPDIPDPHLNVHGRPVEPLLPLEPGVAAGHDEVGGAARLVSAKHKLTTGNLKINVFKYLGNFTTNKTELRAEAELRKN